MKSKIGIAILCLLSLSAIAAPLSDAQLARLKREHKVVVVIDKSLEGTRATSQTLTMYENGRRTLRAVVSTAAEKMWNAPNGRDYFLTTPVGFFRPTYMYSRYQPRTRTQNYQNVTFFVGGVALMGSASWNRCADGFEDVSCCDDIINIRGVRGTQGEVAMSNAESRLVFQAITTTMGRGSAAPITKVNRRTGRLMPGETVNSWDAVIVVHN